MSDEPVRAQPRRNRGPLSAERIFHTSSPVTSKDIQTFLSICVLGWDKYDEDEKHGIISTLPPRYRCFDKDAAGKLKCPLSAEFVATDRTIKAHIAQFQRDVGDGFYTRTWQERARKASEERRQGVYDEYLTVHADEMFGESAVTNEASVLAEDSSDGEFGVKSGRKKARESKAQ